MPPRRTQTNTETPATAITYQYGLANSFDSVLGMTFIAVHVELPVRLRVHNLKFFHINRSKKSAPKLLTGSKSVASFRRGSGQIGDAGTGHRPAGVLRQGKQFAQHTNFTRLEDPVRWALQRLSLLAALCHLSTPVPRLKTTKPAEIVGDPHSENSRFGQAFKLTCQNEGWIVDKFSCPVHLSVSFQD